MTIKTVLKVIIAFVLGISILSSILIFITLQNYQMGLTKTTIAHDIASQVFERRLLADDYITSSSERAKVQRTITFDKLSKQLTETEELFSSSDEKELFTKIKHGLTEGQDTFNALVTLNENPEAVEETTVESLQDQKAFLENQLTVKAQQAISAASSLADINETLVAQNLNTLLLVFCVIGSVFFILLLVSFYFIWTRSTALHDEKAKIQAVLSGIGDGVVVIDTNFTIGLWNKAAESITGWTAQEATGKPLKNYIKLLRSFDRKPDYVFIEEVLLYSEVRHLEDDMLLITKDGTEIHVGDSAAPVFDDRGKIAGVVIVFRDTSHEKESQRLKSDFAYASHQLRTPVTKTVGYLDIAMSETDPKALKEALAVARLSLLSTVKVVGQIVDVSEIDQHQIIPNLTQVSLHTLISETVEKLKEDAVRNGVTIALPKKTSTDTLSLDKRLMERLLFEVIDNAIIYNKKNGKVTINVSEDNGSVVLEIADTGIGIPKEQQALVFTKFFRGSNYNTTEVIGAGLGLFIANEYIKLHKGRMWFDSDETTGTKVFISIPSNKS